MVKENSVILNEIDKARLKLSIEHYTKYFIGKRTCEISKEESNFARGARVRHGPDVPDDRPL